MLTTFPAKLRGDAIWLGVSTTVISSDGPATTDFSLYSIGAISGILTYAQFEK